MQSGTQAAPISKSALWTGRILSAIPVLLLLTSAVAKLLKPPPVLQGFAQFGYSESIILKLAIIELAFTAIYLIPRTSVFGAILLTAYLGGATATHARVGDPAFVGPVLTGVLLWLGLYLRDERLRALVPLRS
jgi:ABC-type Na+ efflux pump permease subunit